MSDHEGFDRIFEDMIRFAEELFGGFVPGAVAVPGTVQTQAERDELIERGDSFNYILNAPGYEEGQLLVSVLDDEISVKTPDFVAKKSLPSRVDADSAVSKYRNGVLSVTVKKRQ